MPVLLSGPAGSGKSQTARQMLVDRVQPTAVIDFQAILAALALQERGGDGRYPPRDASLGYLLPLAEYVRRAAISGALGRQLDVIATNSDGALDRRRELLGLLGPGATETVIDPGLDVVTERLSVNGNLSSQCGEAINRWYGRL